MATKPDGILTLPAEYGRNWAAWYIGKVRERLSRGHIGSVGFHKTLSDGLESYLKKLPADRDLELKLTKNEKWELGQFTLLHATKPENRDKWEDCSEKGWKEFPDEVEAAVAADAARCREMLKEPYIDKPFEPAPIVRVALKPVQKTLV